MQCTNYETGNKRKIFDKKNRFVQYAQAFAFVNEVASLAEEVNHHPDICLYGSNAVAIMLYIHSEDAITDKDYFLAQKIDTL